MSKKDHFNGVWEAFEDDPVQQENLKLGSALMMEIAEMMKDRCLTQAQPAEVLHITPPRVSALLHGKISDFRLDSLVHLAHRLGMHVSMNVAALHCLVSAGTVRRMLKPLDRLAGPQYGKRPWTPDRSRAFGLGPVNAQPRGMSVMVDGVCPCSSAVSFKRLEVPAETIPPLAFPL